MNKFFPTPAPVDLNFLHPCLELTIVEAQGREVRTVAGDGFQGFLVNLFSVNQIENFHFQSNLCDDQIYLV